MIFIDRSVPKSVASALKMVRDDVRWLEDEFSHDIRDPDWLREIGSREWVVVTRDKRIRSRPGERTALMRAGVGCFCLIQGKDPTRWEYLKLIVSTLDEMEQLFRDTERPFLFGIGRTGIMRRII
jgi:PIN like domain